MLKLRKDTRLNFMDQGDYNPLLVTKQSKSNMVKWVFAILAVVIILIILAIVH